MQRIRNSLQTLCTVRKWTGFEPAWQTCRSNWWGAGGKNKDGAQYNKHTLPGKGNGKRNPKVMNREGPPPPGERGDGVIGEVVFGVHPVTLALSANHRGHFHTLYLHHRYRQVVNHHRDDQSSSSPSSSSSPPSSLTSSSSLPPSSSSSSSPSSPPPSSSSSSSSSSSLSSSSMVGVVEMAERRGVPVRYVSNKTLSRLSGNRPHQGVCVDASARHLPLCTAQDLMAGVSMTADLLWLLLYNVQDPMNFGAILRTCHYLGVDKVIIPTTNSCPLSPVVSKASSGAMEVMEMCHTPPSLLSLSRLTQGWKAGGGRVVGTTSERSCLPVRPLQDFAPSSPTLLIVGNEGRGIDVDVVEMCDTLLTIPPSSPLPSPITTTTTTTTQPPSSLPHHPSVTCLNVSVATGILIHWIRSSQQQNKR